MLGPWTEYGPPSPRERRLFWGLALTGVALLLIAGLALEGNHQKVVGSMGSLALVPLVQGFVGRFLGTGPRRR